MNNTIRHQTGLLNAQWIAGVLRESKDLIKDRLFLRCQIQHWDKFTKVCDKQLGADLLYFVAMLIVEVQSEVGTSHGWLCHSDDDSFTVIDLSTVIPKIRDNLQQCFTAEKLAQKPFYVSRIKNQAGGDKIPASLKIATRIITADDFFRMENH